MSKKIELKTKVIQKSICAKVIGDVDSGNALALREALGKIANEDAAVVFLDLASVGRMDSAGIAVLVEAHDNMNGQGRKLALVNTPDSVRSLLELLGVFAIHRDLETGLRETTKIRADWRNPEEPNLSTKETA